MHQVGDQNLTFPPSGAPSIEQFLHVHRTPHSHGLRDTPTPSHPSIEAMLDYHSLVLATRGLESLVLTVFVNLIRPVNVISCKRKAKKFQIA